MRLINSKQSSYQLLIVIVLILIIAPSANGQSATRNVFLPIPARYRLQLINRLQLLTTYQRDENGPAMYNMQAMEGFHGRAFLDFVPHRLDQSFDDKFCDADWRITGVARVRYANVVKEREAYVFAKFINGRWCFSGIIVPEPGLVTD